MDNNKVKNNNLIDENLYDEFIQCLYDDLNLANADKVLFNLIKQLNQAVRSKNDIKVNILYETLMKMLNVLGINLSSIVLNDEDYQNLEQWENHKSKKEYEQADKLREKLMKRGIL